MTEKQQTIKANTERVFSRLATLGSAVTAFRAEREKIQKKEYITQEGKEKQVQAAQNVLTGKFRDSYEHVIDPCLKAIREAAEAMEAEFTISPELQAAITLVGVAGDKLTGDTLRPMWQQFIGNHNALVSLRALFESKDILQSAGDIDKYIFAADSKCSKLEDLALNFYTQPGTNLNQAVTLGQALEDFCKKEGVELDKPFIQYLGADDYSQYMTEQLKAAFGI